MQFVGVSFSFSCLVQVLAACVQEVELNLSKIATPGPKDDPVQLQVITGLPIHDRSTLTNHLLLPSLSPRIDADAAGLLFPVE